MITFCPQPFMFFGQDPSAYLACCPGWMHESRFVTCHVENIWEAWNHPRMVQWRSALLDGDFRWCQRCPMLHGKPLRGRLDTDLPVMEIPPVTYQILDDHACNLRCPSCRPAHCNTRHPPIDFTPLEVERQFSELPTMAMSLSGDPFVSRDCLEFMRTPGHAELIIWTNGILAPQCWSSIVRKVRVVVMSVDAACKETYEQLRPPATWERLLKSLEFLSVIRHDGGIVLWQTNFVVQGANFREMPAFARMCLEYGVDNVQFCTVAPWQHITPDQWDRMNIFSQYHQHHSEFLEVLRHPDLTLPGVDMSLISPAVMSQYGTLRAGSDHLRIDGRLRHD